MKKEEYNGWTNYETWVTSLWIDNDQSSQEYWHERAREIFLGANGDKNFSIKENAVSILSNSLKAEITESFPELTGLACDLLNVSISEINWHEIAKNLLEDNE